MMNNDDLLMYSPSCLHLVVFANKRSEKILSKYTLFTLHLGASHITGTFPSSIACFTMAALCLIPQSVHEAVAKEPWASTSFSSGIPATYWKKGI